MKAKKPQRPPAAPAPVIPLWSQDAHGQIVAHREGQFWHSTGQGQIECLLCYRRCKLAPGEAGWCSYRGNKRGRMLLYDHGVLARAQRQIMGYGGGQRCYLPGAFGLGIGGTHCTARCSFCTSADIVWRPEAIPWQGGRARGLGTSGGWHYAAKAMLHAAGAIEMARHCHADAIVFAENEPLLTYEYTYDCARLAKQAGLKVVLYTNGFSTPAAIQKIARFVDAVDLGIKGSLAPAFYDRWMKSSGATDAVKAALLAWKQAGVHLLISDLVATPVMQTDVMMVEAQERLYPWIAETIGEHTPVMLGAMHTPDNVRPPEPFLVKKTEAHYAEYLERYYASHARAQAAGLPYAHMAWNPIHITCHACRGVLLHIADPQCSLEEACMLHKTYCDCWSHEQHVTADASGRGGTCDHCGAPVPIVTLIPAELAARRADAAANRVKNEHLFLEARAARP